MNLDEWAAHWGINPAAMSQLRQLFGDEPFEAPRSTIAQAGSEAEASDLVQVEASKLGIRLWRNNVGAAYTPGGQLVRYGLANTSKTVNERIKSSDLVGIRPVIIESKHVGFLFGQFIAREMKKPGWTFKSTDHEEAQRKFIALVLAMGGDAAFATGPESL